MVTFLYFQLYNCEVRLTTSFSTQFSQTGKPQRNNLTSKTMTISRCAWILLFSDSKYRKACAVCTSRGGGSIKENYGNRIFWNFQTTTEWRVVDFLCVNRNRNLQSYANLRPTTPRSWAASRSHRTPAFLAAILILPTTLPRFSHATKLGCHSVTTDI